MYNFQVLSMWLWNMPHMAICGTFCGRVGRRTRATRSQSWWTGRLRKTTSHSRTRTWLPIPTRSHAEWSTSLTSWWVLNPQKPLMFTYLTTIYMKMLTIDIKSEVQIYDTIIIYMKMLTIDIKSEVQIYDTIESQASPSQRSWWVLNQ